MAARPLRYFHCRRRRHRQPHDVDIARRGAERAARPPPGAGGSRESREKDGSRAPRGARQRHADRQRRDQGAAGNRHHRRAFRGRRARQAGRSAFHPRQPPDRGGNQARAGRHRRRGGAARTGDARRRALFRTGRQKRHDAGHAQQCQDAGEYRARHRGIEQGDAGKPERAARFHENSRADFRPHERGERQGRQFRASGDSAPLATIIQIGAGLCQLRRAAAQSARCAPGDRRRNRDARGDRARREPARHRAGDDDREHRGSGHRHGDHARDDAEPG